MKLEIEITRKDYSDYHTFYFIRKRLKWFILYCVCGIIFIQFFINKPNFSLKTDIVYCLIYITIFWLAAYFNLRKSRKLPKEGGYMLGKKQIELKNDLIVGQSKESHISYPWKAVRSLGQSKTAFYVFLETNSFIIIPKRHFQNDHDKLTFVSLINERANIA